MPRITELENVVFPVEEHPVFAHLQTAGGERHVRVPGRKAIVNSKSGSVLGIVSRDYRLVSNSEALEMAVQCCQTVFPETKPVEWEVQAVDAPATAGHCQIDLAHNSTALDFQVVAPDQRPEVFGPFISVTNSYNGLRALAFNIGFYRKICRNGMIWPESMVRFSFAHNHRNLPEKIQFEVAHEKLAKVRSSFGDCLSPMQKCTVPRAQFVPMVCGVLHVQPPVPLKPRTREAEEWESLAGFIHSICHRYAEELGENAYAVLNAITDFASHAPNNHCLHRDHHSMQRLAGSWLSRFSQLCQQPNFELTDYIQNLGNKELEFETSPSNGSPLGRSVPHRWFGKN